MNTVSFFELRRRKALLALPILIIPFLTLAFWALGGGKSPASPIVEGGAGLNVTLPQSRKKEVVGLDKLRFYEAADRDSAAWQRKQQQDRFSLGFRDEQDQELYKEAAGAYAYDPAPPGSPRQNAETERLIYEKLEAINRQVSTAELDPYGRRPDKTGPVKDPPIPSQTARPTSSLEQPEDQELSELNQMMDKILDIQHPERVSNRLALADTPMTTGSRYIISLRASGTIHCFGNGKRSDAAQQVFFAIDGNRETPDQESGLLAIIHNRQKVSEGTVVQLRLTHPCFIGVVAVPSGTILYGLASEQEDRLMITIPAIVVNNQLLPVALKVYDLDGLEGIYVPRAPGQKAATESLGNSLQSLPVLAADPSFRAQAATAGLQAVKTLAGRKVRQVKVMLPAGYQVLLKQSK